MLPKAQRCLHTHLNGAMGIAKGRQASITSTFRPIWQGRLLLRIPRDARCRWVTSTEPLPADFHRYALGDCQSVASETAVVSHSPSLSLLLSHPSIFIPAFLLYWFSILLFSPSSLYLLLSSTLSCSWLVCTRSRVREGECQDLFPSNEVAVLAAHAGP